MKEGAEVIGSVSVYTFSDGDTGLVILEDDGTQIKLTGAEATAVAEWILQQAQA